MPEFNEKLELISRLREKCRQCEESLYRARLELYRTNQQLRRADQQPTIVNSDRDREAATLRAKIERLNTRLATLRETARQLAQWFARLTEERRLIEHLQQNLTVTQDRIAALRERLAELQQQEPPPADKIEAIETELARLERVLADVSLSLRKARESLRELEQGERDQRHRQEEVQQEIERLREELGASQGQLTELLQPAFPDRDALGSRRAEIENRRRGLEEQCGNCEGELHDAIVGLYRDPHPRAGLRNLDDGTPFLLFPVRIETIFVPIQGDAAAGTELWVRIYPDDIVVHTHEKVLTDREVLAGELYWTELFTAEHLRDERDKRRRAAWRHIVELLGGQRAAWIASHTKPNNWDSLVAGAAARTLPELLVAADAEFFDKLLATSLPPTVRTALEKALTENDGDAFSQLAEKREWFGLVNAAVKTVITGFPVHDLTKTDAWTRAPRAQLLPDRFVLLLSNNDGPPREIVGNVIPDTLFLGPDPLASETPFPDKPEDHTLIYDKSFDWMSNFDKAVEHGMGFRVRLNETESRRGFARVLVLGVFLSATAPDSAALLEELIDNHHYSPKGFSIVPQGTPTNNTERDGTGYSNNDPYDDLAFFTAIDPPAFDPADPNPAKSQTDGRFLADALGISYDPLLTIQYANQTDLLEASSMSTALFPGTLGYWLRNWMSPVVTPEIARQARSFFTRFVTGRGPLPAVRIGDQPYGLLLTSDFSRWKYPERSGPVRPVRIFEDEVAFLRKLHSLLLALQQIWTNKVSALPYIGKPFTESGDVLMKILGLHPNSVEFYQRIGYTHAYLGNLLNFKGKGRHTGEMREHMMLMGDRANDYLTSLGIVNDFKTVSDMLCLQVLWQHYTSNLDSPNLIENKPPSEKNGLTVNYIDFLANADNTQKIITQDFPTTPPSALLYLMLRNALLLQLHSGAYEWLKERTIFHPAFEQATRATSLADIRPSSPTVSRLEIMGARVEVAEPTNPVPSTTVADWIWQGPLPTEVEAAFLREQKAALTNLVKTPTARLERCFIEHLDCCNYRLDAWQTGMFAQRLQSQRGSGQGRRKGIYLGAFGWVENLSPAVKTFLSPESLPASLRPADTQPILEEDDVMASLSARTRLVGSRQGGFVHAPSLNHAAAAALLRNAYLSHARPEQPDMFSVNLSSERVRRGQFILEGMRNGQPIEALLGYQFERGLHDRTSASEALDEDPVLELNQFIVPFREAFPFESVELAQTGTGAPSETIPPYSVVNGLKLSQATLSAANAFGLANVLSAALQPKPSHGDAILAEKNALRDTLDAVKDLLLAENAFQLARGNFDRVAAVSLAQKEAHIPPELEVINTPRGTEFTFTNRVTLQFEDVDPETNPWFPAPMTPRATAEPGMNQWLASLLGQPGQIFCKVFWIEKEGGLPRNQHRISLAALGIQPIDFVWLTNLSAEETQGATELETRSGATELETRIAYVYRSTHGVGDDKVVKIEFNPDVVTGETSFARLFPLARQLRALLSESRALHAGDFLPAAGGKESEIPVNKDNPKGYDAAELKARVQTALTDLGELADFIDAPSVEIVFINDPAIPADDEIFVGKLGDAFTKLEEAKVAFSDTTRLSVTFLLLDAKNLHANLQAVASFGIGDAFPPESDLTVEAAKLSLLARAHRVARRLRRADPQDGVLDRATALVGNATTAKSIEQQVTLLLEAGKILFGETFNLLPKFTCHNEVDLATAAGDRTQLLSFATTSDMTAAEVVDEWLQGLARVRKPLARWEVVRTLADALNEVSLKVEPVQVPYRKNDSWLAVEFPKLDPNNTDPEEPEKPFGISRDTLSIAAHGKAAFQAGVKQSGVLIDDWTEEIPTEKEITGITFRFNQPNAAPPQTILLAVTPEETGSWEWDDLVGTLNDTLERAKRRAVEPSLLEPQGKAWNAFAPALVSEFSTRFRNDISLDLLGMMDVVELNEFYTRRV